MVGRLFLALSRQHTSCFQGLRWSFIYLLDFKIEVSCYFVEHAPVDPVKMTYSNGYQNARTGVGSKVVAFIRPCGYDCRSCLGLGLRLGGLGLAGLGLVSTVDFARSWDNSGMWSYFITQCPGSTQVPIRASYLYGAWRNVFHRHATSILKRSKYIHG